MWNRWIPLEGFSMGKRVPFGLQSENRRLPDELLDAFQG